MKDYLGGKDSPIDFQNLGSFTASWNLHKLAVRSNNQAGALCNRETTLLGLMAIMAVGRSQSSTQSKYKTEQKGH